MRQLKQWKEQFQVILHSTLGSASLSRAGFHSLERAMGLVHHIQILTDRSRLPQLSYSQTKGSILPPNRRHTGNGEQFV